MRCLPVPLALLALFALTPRSAWCQTPVYNPGSSALEERLSNLEAEIRALRAEQQSQQPQAPFENAPQQTGFVNSLNSSYEATNNSGYYQQSAAAAAPTFPSVIVSGFFQADAGAFSQSAANMAAVGDIQNGADFRRARLLSRGDVYNNVGYWIEMDFAFPGRPSFMDVFVEQRQLPLLGTVRVGQWRQPFGLDALTSVKELLFLERALPFAFVPFRQLGIGFMNYSPNELMTLNSSIFRFPADQFGGNVGDNGGFGGASRFTILPWIDEDGYRVVHFGLDYSYLNPSSDQVQYRNQPEFFVGETGGAALPGNVPTQVPFFVNTGAINVVQSQLYGAELAGVWGPLYAASEVYYASVIQKGGLGTASFSGAYGQVAWLLFGQQRQYNRTGGVFGRPQPLNPFGTGPQNGWGAWELAARWSYLDLNSKNIAGGTLGDLTFGLNWYLNPRVKFQFNNIHAYLNTPGIGPSQANIVAARCQMDF